MTTKLNILTSEHELIAQCRKRDRNAQRHLFGSYSQTMLALCCRYVGDQSLAEEIMLDGFMTVFDKLDQYSHTGSFEGWIRKIMVNKCLTWIRKNKRMYLDRDIDDLKDSAVVEAVANQLEAEELMAMIRELPQGYRIVFNMYAIEGYSHKEIADLLQISENTSKSQLSRARRHLQSRLANYYTPTIKQDKNGS